MHRTIALAIVGLFFMATIPGVQAETKTAEYDVPSGPTGNFGLAVTTRPCASEWRDWEGGLIGDDDELDDPTDPLAGELLTVGANAGCSAVDPEADGAVRIGVFSAAIEAEADLYTSFLVTVTDTLPTATYFLFCVITEHQDGRGYGDSWCGENAQCDEELNPADCDDIEDPRGAGCGSLELTSPVPAGGPENGATAFVYGSFVDDTTGAVCLGSKGSLTVSFS